MLEELAKKDSYWRKIALNISKDRMIADDLVNDMYIKLHDSTKQINDFYVIIVIRNLFLDYVKAKKQKVSLDLFFNLAHNNEVLELNDYEVGLLEDCNKLSYLQLGLLSESYDLSIREIAEKYKFIDYGLIYRELDKARKKILGNDIDLYKNKRLKWQK